MRSDSPHSEPSPTAIRLIVNADDFGLAEIVNDGIVQAHRDGMLTSASLMANGAAFDDAVCRARAAPGLDLGVHLTLVEERPVLDPREVPSLVGADGCFHRSAARFARRYARGRINADELRRELQAQCERIRAAGFRPTHFDSHQHVHLLPGVLRVVIDLAREYGIGAIRLPRERAPLRWLGRAPLARVAGAVTVAALSDAAASHIPRRVDGFAGFFEGGHLSAARLRALLGRLSGGTWELMTHPGAGDAGPRYRHWHYHWQDELRALTDPDVLADLRQRGIELTSFGAVAASGGFTR
ncbi:MAG TPA: ChbG/HpnK family deacetylase [Gemmatimonadales bacterium]|nr:ChbG/HpnK family deacetylase [Gemmatimonadales bacterium]